MFDSASKAAQGGVTPMPQRATVSDPSESKESIMTTTTTPAPVSPLSLEDGALAFASAKVDTMRTADHSLALIAFRSGGSNGAFASAAALAAATHGEEHLRSAFVPTNDVPTWDEHLAQAAARSPYSESESGIRNLRNAVRILHAAGLPTDDALIFADAKRAAPNYTTAEKAKRFGAALSIASSPRDALRSSVSSRSVAKGAADAKASAKAKEDTADRKADPIGYAFEALAKACGSDPDAMDRLADRAEAFAKEQHALAKARRTTTDGVTTDAPKAPAKANA